MSDQSAPSPWYRGWRLWKSDADRDWATRTQPFDPAAVDAGATRVVDADDPITLASIIDAQELIAEQTSRV